jgi:hypothetical protein
LRRAPPAAPSVQIGLWCDPQILLDRDEAFGEFLLDHFAILYGGHDHSIITMFPIAGRCHAMGVGELQRIDDAQNLVDNRGRAGNNGLTLIAFSL